jgi:epoxyqueuosine reductase
MTSKRSMRDDIISKAESLDDIQAGMARLDDVLDGPSYEAAPDGLGLGTSLSDTDRVVWPAEARTVLVLGLYHPKHDPRLDWWERGDSWGNRRLRAISRSLKQWLREAHGLGALPLPYYVEKGGLFLKDAAVRSGIGVIGRNNLLVNHKWGPRIRLRALLLEGDVPTTQRLEGFSPCETCKGFCQKACPVKAFPEGRYNRSICFKEIHANAENRTPEGEIGENGERNLVVKYCRACEWSCPAGHRRRT